MELSFGCGSLVLLSLLLLGHATPGNRKSKFSQSAPARIQAPQQGVPPGQRPVSARSSPSQSSGSEFGKLSTPEQHSPASPGPSQLRQRSAPPSPNQQPSASAIRTKGRFGPPPTPNSDQKNPTRPAWSLLGHPHEPPSLSGTSSSSSSGSRPASSQSSRTSHTPSPSHHTDPHTPFGPYKSSIEPSTNSHSTTSRKHDDPNRLSKALLAVHAPKLSTMKQHGPNRASIADWVDTTIPKKWKKKDEEKNGDKNEKKNKSKKRSVSKTRPIDASTPPSMSLSSLKSGSSQGGSRADVTHLNMYQHPMGWEVAGPPSDAKSHNSKGSSNLIATSSGARFTFGGKFLQHDKYGLSRDEQGQLKYDPDQMERGHKAEKERLKKKAQEKARSRQKGGDASVRMGSSAPETQMPFFWSK